MKFFIPFVTLSLLSYPISASPILALQGRDACSSDVQKLIDGINSNIAVQKDEQAQASVLASILSSDTIDNDDFNVCSISL
jgi:hypothetical protein